MSGADGVVRGALAELAEAAAGEGGEQLGLLPLGEPVNAERRAEVAARERKAGRPPGATNLATRDLRKALHAMGFDGVWQMARWGSLTPEELAARLGCTRLEAFDRLTVLWDRVGRYQHAPLAPTDGAGNVAPMMVMHVGGREATATNARPPWEWDAAPPFIEDEQNQPLGEGDAAASKDASSKEDEKP